MKKPRRSVKSVAALDGFLILNTGALVKNTRYSKSRPLSNASVRKKQNQLKEHQGKTESFHRLITLLEPKAFPDIGSVTKDKIKPYIIRTEKRKAVNAEGKPLFLPRVTTLVPVQWEARHAEQKKLYEAVTHYVREGYNQAMLEKRSYIGFLMILMQRMMVSSTRAI